MNVTKQMIVVMTVIGVLSSVVLAASDMVTKGMIAKNQQKALEAAVFKVLPGAKTYEAIGTETFSAYKGMNEQRQLVGYAFIAEGPGFQGTIRMMVGIDPEFKSLFGMDILEQVETPGLGGNISTEKFKRQFSGLTLAVDGVTSASGYGDVSYISYVKNIAPQKPGEIQAITGATISSKAVVKTLNSSLTQLAKLLAQ
ncbi:electron transport complex, RnfABCDGE type, G subunit [Candidatus Moduliflexus flocculans]|uniref:Ion-translocating oxidoreductase complex subunit G n=1 Tax=Candidatus Moduliflexus flocculans TaxID=1499966 RepID=A0A0S6W125_9BACT|nr:electron transport complex, RnfABCDGE type, G subunit [Candidatus Moduliflexus flocculans]